MVLRGTFTMVEYQSINNNRCQVGQHQVTGQSRLDDKVVITYIMTLHDKLT